MLKVIGALIPSAGLLFLFWLALRALVTADRRERAAEAKWKREHGIAPAAAGAAGAAVAAGAADRAAGTAGAADGGRRAAGEASLTGENGHVTAESVPGERPPTAD